MRLPIPITLVAAGLLAACTGDQAGREPPGGTAKAQAPQPPRVFETTAHQWEGGWGKGLKVRYETSLDITDVPVLRVEADSIWATLRPSAERDSVCSVELEASTPQRTLPVPGATQVSARRNFSFLIRHDSAGTWRWMTSTDQPLNPCAV